MRVLSGKAAAEYVRRIAGRSTRFDELEPAVRRIVADVRRNGDSALRKYAEKWDGVSGEVGLRVPEKEIRSAWKQADPNLKRSLRIAAANIRRYCEKQKPREWDCSVSNRTILRWIRSGSGLL